MTVCLYPIENLPDIQEKDNLPLLIAKSLREQRLDLEDNDIIVIAQKVVSKAEGRNVLLEEVEVSQEAKNLAQETGVTPEVVQLILQESSEILKIRPGLIIPRHRLGYICANAGIDRSNTGRGDGKAVVLLPKDPDASAKEIREALEEEFDKKISVIINDSQGRPFREGAVGVAIGISGIAPIEEHINKVDLYGYTLKTSQEGIVDELASAATLLMGQSNEGIPAVLIRGFKYRAPDHSIKEIIREPHKDLFK